MFYGLPVAVVTPDDSSEEVFIVPQASVTVADKDHACITGCCAYHCFAHNFKCNVTANEHCIIIQNIL